MKIKFALIVMIAATLLIAGCFYPVHLPVTAATSTPLNQAETVITPAITPAQTEKTAVVPDGWNKYECDSFSLALPERWKAIDVSKEGIDSVINLIKGYSDEWAQSIISSTSKDLQKNTRFWAMDPQKSGVGYSTVSIEFLDFTDMPPSTTEKEIGDSLKAEYEKHGINIISVKNDLDFDNGTPLRMEIKLSNSAAMLHEYQYLFVKEKSGWLMTCTVDNTQWETYEPIFSTIAETLVVK
jgi:hypothetical protein